MEVPNVECVGFGCECDIQTEMKYFIDCEEEQEQTEKETILTT
jgi:hypothetical protein